MDRRCPEHDSVEPPPDHRRLLGGSEQGDQVARRHSVGARTREGRGVRHNGPSASPEDGAALLVGREDNSGDEFGRILAAEHGGRVAGLHCIFAGLLSALRLSLKS
jgi:hypothetical protein